MKIVAKMRIQQEQRLEHISKGVWVEGREEVNGKSNCLHLQEILEMLSEQRGQHLIHLLSYQQAELLKILKKNILPWHRLVLVH